MRSKRGNPIVGKPAEEMNVQVVESVDADIFADPGAWARNEINRTAGRAEKAVATAESILDAAIRGKKASQIKSAQTGFRQALAEKSALLSQLPKQLEALKNPDEDPAFSPIFFELCTMPPKESVIVVPPPPPDELIADPIP